jgi:hypothetical protein
MKRTIITFFVGCLMVLSAGCEWKRSEQEFIQISPESVQITIVVPDSDNPTSLSPTPTHDFAWADSRASCQFTSDCILMRVGGCENVQAIHVSQVKIAEEWTTRSKEEFPNVVCAPDWPIEDYDPFCLNQKCRAVLRNYHMILEVPEQPVAGLPFWLGMSFRYHIGLEQVYARFILPEDVKIVSGQEFWSGPVEAGKDYVLWVEVQTTKVGDLYLGGGTLIKQGDQGIPPLGWSDHIYVSSPNSLTPWPEHEWILPTPTPIK